MDKDKYEPKKIQDDIMNKELPQVLALFPGVRSKLSGASQQQVEIQHDLVRGGLVLFARRGR